jgi:hypothetical protein
LIANNILKKVVEVVEIKGTVSNRTFKQERVTYVSNIYIAPKTPTPTMENTAAPITYTEFQTEMAIRNGEPLVNAKGLYLQTKPEATLDTDDNGKTIGYKKDLDAMLALSFACKFDKPMTGIYITLENDVEKETFLHWSTLKFIENNKFVLPTTPLFLCKDRIVTPAQGTPLTAHPVILVEPTEAHKAAKDKVEEYIQSKMKCGKVKVGWVHYKDIDKSKHALVCNISNECYKQYIGQGSEYTLIAYFTGLKWLGTPVKEISGTGFHYLGLHELETETTEAIGVDLIKSAVKMWGGDDLYENFNA